MLVNSRSPLHVFIAFLRMQQMPCRQFTAVFVMTHAGALPYHVRSTSLVVCCRMLYDNMAIGSKQAYISGPVAGSILRFVAVQQGEQASLPGFFACSELWAKGRWNRMVPYTPVTVLHPTNDSLRPMGMLSIFRTCRHTLPLAAWYNR